MERTFSPMVRQFSAIAGLQQAYTLVYSLDPDGETGCRLNNNIPPQQVLIRHALSEIDGQLRMNAAPILLPTRPLFRNIHHRQI